MFLKIAFLSFIFLLSAGSLCAQTLSGHISNGESGEPLGNVNIQIAGTHTGASSNEEGNYYIKVSSDGEYTITASMIGYKTASRTISVASDSVNRLDIRLFPTVLQLKPIEVTARKYRDVVDSPKLESPALYTAISVVKKDEIEKQGAKTLTESMQYVPGGLIESRGRKVKQFFSIRGQTYPYPEFSLNGSWQREFHELPYFFPSSEIERIEIIRSSTALLTGLTGLAGIIKVDTRLYESMETSLDAAYGTFGTYRLRFSHGSKLGNISYATGLGIQGTQGPENKNAGEQIGSAYGRMLWQPSEQFDFDLNVLYFTGKRELALAEPPAGTNLQTTISKYDPYRATLVNLRTFYKQNAKTSSDLQLHYSSRNPVYVTETNQGTVSTPESDYEYGANFTQTVTPLKDNTLRLGGLYNHWVAPNGKRFYSGRRCDLETFSLVAVEEHQFGNLNLDAGFRWARTYINEYGAFNIDGVAGGFASADPVRNTWEPGILNASLGGAYFFDKPFSVHLNLSSGQIKPREGSLTVDLQKPENEHRLKVDLGIQTILADIGQLTLTGFLVRQDNAIVLSDTFHMDDGRILEYYLNQNQGQAGIEFEGRSALWLNSLECFFNMLFMYSRFEKDGVKTTNKKIPQFISSAGIYFDYAGIDFNFFAKYVSSFENSRFAARVNGQPPQPQPLGDYLLLNATFGKTFGKEFRTRFYIEIQNISDVRYSTVVGYPDFGRRVIGGVSQVFR